MDQTNASNVKMFFKNSWRTIQNENYLECPGKNSKFFSGYFQSVKKNMQIV